MYTPEEIRKAAELGEVSMIDVEHVISLLPEARVNLQGKYIFKHEYVNGQRTIHIDPTEAKTQLYCENCKHSSDGMGYPTTIVIDPSSPKCKTCDMHSNYTPKK